MITPRSCVLALFGVACLAFLATCAPIDLRGAEVCDADVDCLADYSDELDSDAPPEVIDPDGGGDGDGDVDGDADGGTGRGTMTRWVGRCHDGVDEGDLIEGFRDCEARECMVSGACCQETSRRWVQGDFSVCADVGACGWNAFPDEPGGVAVERPWVVLTAARDGEAGIYTAEPVGDLHGEPLLTFAAALDPVACTAQSCQQLLGVALTAQESVSVGTGVLPTLGLVLDGELSVVALVVGGRVEDSFPVPLAELTELRGYALRLADGGVVEVLLGLEVDDGAGAPAVVVEGSPITVQTQGQLGDGGSLRLVVFGRLAGGSARVGAVGFERPVCDDPDGFTRTHASEHTGAGLVTGLASAPDGVALGRPSVVPMAWAPDTLLMVFEEGLHLAVATSADGAAWEHRGAILAGNGPSEYGVVARRAPSVVAVDADGRGPDYHLWYEGVSENAGIASGGEPRTAIVHATSWDGFEWLESPDEEAAVIGGPDHVWRLEVGAPSVAVAADGSLVMVFVGTNSYTGATALGQARSDDGKVWTVDADPLRFDSGERLPFERDGVGSPQIVTWGRSSLLWYTGVNGSELAIGTAFVSEWAGAQPTWTRYGPVLVAGEVWEARRVLAPAVVLRPVEGEAALAELFLWYQAGLQGRERIGLATRELPALETLAPLPIW
jgi:hypothetical protein